MNQCTIYHRLPLEPISGLLFPLFDILSDLASVPKKKREKVLNISARFSMACASFKKDVPSAYAV